MLSRRPSAALALVSLGAALALSIAGSAQAQSTSDQSASLRQQGLRGLSHRPVCPLPTGADVRCRSQVVLDPTGKPLASRAVASGYRPADLASAYKYPLPAPGSAWSWNGQTVAIVDAYRNPNAAADLAAYRGQLGLPACSAASGCFREVNQNGAASPLPASDIGWGQEISLDLDMVSAVCPSCRILLVDANSSSLSSLGTAVNSAARLGANAISNSYGANEFSSEASYGDAYYNNHPGIAITVSAGDSGYGVEFPAASRNVIAVGGTSLTRTTSARGWSESVWGGSGSGCSAYIAQQSWQQATLANQQLTGCSKRVVADVAAVADPITGVAVYDSYGSTSGANWYVFGGTSVAAPIIGSIYTLANAARTGSVAPSYLYSHTAQLFDVASGSNGACTSGARPAPAYLCTGRSGYDGPTGLGTPNGLGAF